MFISAIGNVYKVNRDEKELDLHFSTSLFDQTDSVNRQTRVLFPRTC